MKEKIVNVQTGEEIFIDFTPDELAENKARLEQESKDIEAAKAAKEAAHAAVLEKLGLTADELAALLA
jgi:hypothetical protein